METKQEDGVLLLTAQADIAILEGAISGLETLQSRGIDTITFTNGTISVSFSLAEVIAKGASSDIYRLTLSGGEAQRVKLATELSKRSTGRTIYILDEPTTGLHTADVKKLLEVLQRLVDAGNTVLVIEHNLDVIKCADYLLDLGPEGGGGTLVTCGTPEEVAACEQSYTGQYLRKMLR